MVKEGTQEGAWKWTKGSRNIWRSVTHCSSALVFDHCGCYTAISKSPSGFTGFWRLFLFYLSDSAVFKKKKKRSGIGVGPCNRNWWDSTKVLAISLSPLLDRFSVSAEQHKLPDRSSVPAAYPGVSLGWHTAWSDITMSSAGALGGHRRTAPGVPAGESCGLPWACWSKPSLFQPLGSWICPLFWSTTIPCSLLAPQCSLPLRVLRVGH